MDEGQTVNSIGRGFPHRMPPASASRPAACISACVQGMDIPSDHCRPGHSWTGCSVLTAGVVRLMNGVFPGYRSRSRRFRLDPRSFRIAPPRLAAGRPGHLLGELIPSCDEAFLPGFRGLPMSIHRCAWRAQDARASGASCADLLRPLLRSLAIPQRHFPWCQAFFRRPGPYETPRPSFGLGRPTFAFRLGSVIPVRSSGLRLAALQIGRAHV